MENCPEKENKNNITISSEVLCQLPKKPPQIDSQQINQDQVWLRLL